MAAWEMLIGSFWHFDLRSVHYCFSDPNSPISDLRSTTIRISRMIPIPYLHPYMGFGIHQPYGIAYGGDQKKPSSTLTESEILTRVTGTCAPKASFFWFLGAIIRWIWLKSG